MTKVRIASYSQSSGLKELFTDARSVIQRRFQDGKGGTQGAIWPLTSEHFWLENGITVSLG
jgi:hypothetical protein